MSSCVWAVLTADFKFLNVGPKAWQAQQMYDMVMLNARNTRFEDLIWNAPKRPHPKIVLRFKIGPILYESSLEYMSVDKNATGILSWEGDWLHIDEAGLLDNLEEVVINVGSRLRGKVRGRSRLGRFSMTSNSWDNYFLWQYFDQASADPENFLSISISSRHNHNVSEEQLNRMLARIPKSERKRFIDGTRPEGRGNFFDKQSVYKCEFLHGIEFAKEMEEKGRPGWKVEKLHGAGYTYYTTPPLADRIYMLFGDPGAGEAPKRNAPVLMCWDVTDFPTLPAKLVAFYWGNGGGKIGPFIQQLLEFVEVYEPLYAGIDSTGPQKHINQLINEYALKERFEENQVPIGIVKGISGMDFSGSKKVVYLQAARLLVEAGLLSWPKKIVGIRSQLTNYELEKDKKIPQDIVATMAMSAHAIRMWFHVTPEEIFEQMRAESGESADKDRRLSLRERSRRSVNAR